MLARTTILNSTSSLDFNLQALNSTKSLKKSNDGEEVEFNSKNNGMKSLEGENGLTEEEKVYLEKLKERDKEVRQHEQAHQAAAGELASGSANYEYKIGPDGKRYVVGGNVKIDTSKVPDDPEATVEKAQKIKRAALAPTNPSPKDRQVASAATRMEQQAKSELAKAEKAERQEKEAEAKIKNVSRNEGRQAERPAPDFDVYDSKGELKKFELELTRLNKVI